jgi:hypothetical protein
VHRRLARAWLDAARGETGRVVGFLILWKLCFWVFIGLALALFPRLFSDRMYWANYHGPVDVPPPAMIELQTWDAQHYLHLAEHGYTRGDPSIAFFPLWPYAIRAAAPVTGGDHFWAGLLLANALSIAALALLHRLVLRRTGDRRVADTTLLVAAAYPGALFLSFPYSEALFLCLALAAMSALVEQRWRAAVLWAFFLPLTRGTGIFIGLPLMYACYRRWRDERRFPVRPFFAMAVPLLGLAAYFAFMYVRTGSPLAGFDAQGAFISQRSTLGLIDVPALLRALVDFEPGHAYRTSMLDRIWFLLFAASLVHLWRRDRLMFWYALPMGLLPPMTSFMSYTRYLLLAFPVFMVAGQLLARDRAQPLRWALLGLLVALQALLALRHVSFLWAG